MPVALPEGLPLRLAVVGQHDEPIGARSVASGRCYSGDLAIHLAQNGERVWTLDARVVRDFVVGQERGVDHGPPGQHVSHDRGDLEVELDHGGKCAHEGVLARTVDARVDVAPAREGLRAALARDVGDHGEKRLRHRVGPGEVGRVVPADRAAPSQHRAHRQHRVRGIAERVFARLAPSPCSRPLPSERRRSSSSASRGWLVTMGRPRSFSHQRKAGMSWLLPCRSPAWRRPSGTTSRSPILRGGGCPPAPSRPAPARCRPRIARRSTSWARPSISRKTMPGTSLSLRSPRRRSWRRTTLRYHDSSSSMARRA